MAPAGLNRPRQRSRREGQPHHSRSGRCRRLHGARQRSGQGCAESRQHESSPYIRSVSDAKVLADGRMKLTVFIQFGWVSTQVRAHSLKCRLHFSKPRIVVGQTQTDCPFSDDDSARYPGSTRPQPHAGTFRFSRREQGHTPVVRAARVSISRQSATRVPAHTRRLTSRSQRGTGSCPSTDFVWSVRRHESPEQPKDGPSRCGESLAPPTHRRWRRSA